LFNCFFQAEDGIRYRNVTGVQTCALPISSRRFIPLFLACNARLESFRCSFFNFFSIFTVNLLLLTLRPSERMAKSVMPKSILIDVSVLCNVCTSVSTRMDIKYLLLGFLLTVV